MAQAVIIDANLLLVFVIGRDHKDYLGKRRHTKHFMPEDYDTLCEILSRYDRIIVTPNAVTECNNLLGDTPDFDDAKQTLKFIVSQSEIVDESYIPSKDAAQMPQFKFLGISDCALLSLVGKQTVLLTCDNKLAVQAQRVNPDSINFNHLRNFLG